MKLTCPKSSQSCQTGDYQMNKEHLLSKANKCDRSVATTIKDHLLSFLILNLCFGSWWIILLLCLSS